MTGHYALLDLIAPPAGCRFVQGIWLTHDCSLQAVNDSLLPALAGLGAAERSAGRSAPGLLGEGALTILAAADRVNTRGLLPGRVIRLIPVIGRRQHAKAAVLQYERVDAAGNHIETLVRTLVMSANLTKGGLTTNREVVAMETIDIRTEGEVIALAVLDAIGTLASGDLDTSESLSPLLRDLRQAIPAGLLPANAAIAASLGGEPQEPFVAMLPPGGASSLLLVGPAFAADNSDVTRLLGSILGADTEVHLVVDTKCSAEEIAGGSKVSVPSRLLDGLRSRAGAVTVYAAATDDASTKGSRWLHGKTIIGEWDGVYEQMLGSVNLTARGLTGRNREMVTLVSLEGGDRVLDGLTDVGAIQLDENQIVPTAEQEQPLLPTVERVASPVQVHFIPDAEQHAGMPVLYGTIVVRGSAPGESIKIDFVEYRLEDGVARRVTFHTSRSRATIRLGGLERSVVVVLAPAEGESFWTSVPIDTVPERVDPLLWFLLRDLERATRSSNGEPESDPPPAVSSQKNDGFSLPANMRLNVLARHHRSIRRVDPQTLKEVLAKLFPCPVEREVAATIVSASVAESVSTTEPLLRALAGVISQPPASGATHAA